MINNALIYIAFLLMFIIAVAMLMNGAIPSAVFMAAAGGVVHPVIKFRTGWMKGALVLLLIVISILFVPIE